MKTLILFAAMATLANAAFASEIIKWHDLIDVSAQTFDDPYRDLSYDDIQALKTTVSVQKSLENEGLTKEKQAELKAKGDNARLHLLERGIDSDWFIDQRWVVAERREKAATAGNPAVDGQVVALSGYAIPAPPDKDGTPVAYLVPERGMCSHMPSPNANQMIRVRLTDAWQPSMTHEPVRLTGKLSIAPTQERFRIVDGPVQMNATFLMTLERAETMDDENALESGSVPNDWASTLAQKLRASGALPAARQEVTE
jgi:hypothetical protein